MCDGYDVEKPVVSTPASPKTKQISFLEFVLKSCRWYVLERRIQLEDEDQLSPEEEAEYLKLTEECDAPFNDFEESMVTHLAAIIERTSVIPESDRGPVMEAFLAVYRVYNADALTGGLDQISATLRSLGVTEFPERYDADKQTPEAD